MNKFDALDYWGKLAISLTRENADLRYEILRLQIINEQIKEDYSKISKGEER